MTSKGLRSVAFLLALASSACWSRPDRTAASPNPAPQDTQAAAEAAALRDGCRNYLDEQLARYLNSEVPDASSASPNRTAVFDLVLPADRSQFQALNRMAILGIKIVGRDKSDFPIQNVYFAPDSHKTQLSILPVIARGNPYDPIPTALQKSIQARYGSQGEELFLLIPMRFLGQNGEIGIQFKNRRRTLKIARLPIEMPSNLGSQDLQSPESPNRKPDDKLVLALLQRYYCLKI